MRRRLQGQHVLSTYDSVSLQQIDVVLNLCSRRLPRSSRAHWQILDALCVATYMK